MEALVSPVYKYKILLDPSSAKGNYFHIVKKDSRNKYHNLILDQNFIEVYTQEAITQQQLLDMFDRTEGIIGIRGDFKDENTIKNYKK